jgi:hypothetical protein
MARTTAETAYFHSVGDFLGYVESSKDAAGAWKKLGTERQDGNSSLKTETDFYGPMLDDFLGQCRTLGGLQQACGVIDTLAQDLSAQIPATSIVRHRTRGTSGYALNPHRVLRGQLSTAWTRMTRTPHPVPGHGDIVLCISPGASWVTKEAGFLYSSAATAALALTLHAAGYRVAVWALTHTVQCWHDGESGMLGMQLLAPGEPWQTQTLALTTQKAWHRRLQFRWLEMQQQRHGGMDNAYGHSAQPHTPEREHALAQFRKEHGLEHAVVLDGAHASMVATLESARGWLEGTITRLEMQD